VQASTAASKGAASSPTKVRAFSMWTSNRRSCGAGESLSQKEPQAVYSCLGLGVVVPQLGFWPGGGGVCRGTVCRPVGHLLLE
jgi:hypothetical protein